VKILVDGKKVKFDNFQLEVDRDLPKSADSYFQLEESSVRIPIDSLVLTRCRDKGVKNAYEIMKLVAYDQHAKRQPISVKQDGVDFLVEDGNSTCVVLHLIGVDSVIANVL